MKKVKRVRLQPRTVMVWVLSSAIIIAQWYHEHRICNWLATFWVRELFQASILFSSTFFWVLERISLFCKSLLSFSTFVNCEGAYLAKGLLHNFSLGVSIRSHHRNKQQDCWNSSRIRVLLKGTVMQII